MPNTKTELVKCPGCKQTVMGTWVKGAPERVCVHCGEAFNLKEKSND